MKLPSNVQTTELIIRHEALDEAQEALSRATESYQVARESFIQECEPDLKFYVYHQDNVYEVHMFDERDVRINKLNVIIPANGEGSKPIGLQKVDQELEPDVQD